MTGDRRKLPLGAAGWVATLLVAAMAFVIGFIWLPSLQAGGQGGWWDAICRAVGIYPKQALASAAALPAEIPTTVVWDVQTLRIAASGNAQRGGALAAGCAGCHGANGISASDAYPNLVGLGAVTIYKQLDDYRSGKRQNPIMQAMAAPLTDQNIADLAAHFASFPARRKAVEPTPAQIAADLAANYEGGPPDPMEAYASAPILVVEGKPSRSIAPCAACHGPLGHKHGAPPLSGQKEAYLKTQLDAFATGARHNDMNKQMREVASALTARERDALAAWYGEAHESP